MVLVRFRNQKTTIKNKAKAKEKIFVLDPVN